MGGQGVLNLGIRHRARQGLALVPVCFVFLAVLATACEPENMLKQDEVVTFFPTFGRRAADRVTWVVAIHGWVYTLEDSGGRDRGLELFARAFGLGAAESEREPFRSRVRLFLAENQDERRISVRVGNKTFPVGETGKNGHVEGPLNMSPDWARGLIEVRGLTDGWVPFRAVTRGGDRREFVGAFQLIEQEGVSVISDIDDTIKITGVPDRKELLANTFLREFRAVPGMAEAYRRWAMRGAVFHYVTASPWQLYEPLSHFLRDHGFPAGSFHMKPFRWKDSTFLSLFASPEQSKPGAIEPILSAFPRRRFILVGDSGEKDPEIYGALARKYPAQITAIYIRDVGAGASGARRFAAAFRDLPPDRWRVFRSADVLALALEEHPAGKPYSALRKLD